MNLIYPPTKIVGTSLDLFVGRDIRVLATQPDRTTYNQKGKVTGVNENVELPDRDYRSGVFVTDAYIEPGFSGGILADRDGTFLGVTQMRIGEYASGIGMDRVIPFLQVASAKESKKILQYKT